jgi:predicted nucleic acid-binding protein
LARPSGKGRLSGEAYAEAVAAFEDLHAELTAIGVDDELSRRTGLAAEFGLRGYDVVHLATALEVGEQDIYFLSWDRALARAADQAGLGTAVGD